MTEGGGMTFYGRNFQGPLAVRIKHFAAHSILGDNFFMPTLGIIYREKIANYTGFKIG